MSRFRAFAVGTSLTAGLLVGGAGAAFAAGTTTSLSATQMVTALNAAAATTESAAAPGWRAAMIMHGGGMTGSELFVMDPAGGIALDQVDNFGKGYTDFVADHQGIYELVGSATERGAVRMMKRPDVRYSFTANKTLDLATYAAENSPSPITALTDDTNHAGTQTVNDDGSTDYRFTDKEKDAVALSVNSSGILTAATVTTTDISATVTFGYGAQHPGRPAPAATMTATELARGVEYLRMNTTVKEAANQAAEDTRQVSNNHVVKVATLRKQAKGTATYFNEGAGLSLVKVAKISGGAKLYATNPWTHKTIAYTVKASGRKVIVHKA
jgi:hypothetical protein